MSGHYLHTLLLTMENEINGNILLSLHCTSLLLVSVWFNNWFIFFLLMLSPYNIFDACTNNNSFVILALST